MTLPGNTVSGAEHQSGVLCQGRRQRSRRRGSSDFGHNLAQTLEIDQACCAASIPIVVLRLVGPEGVEALVEGAPSCFA